MIAIGVVWFDDCQKPCVFRPADTQGLRLDRKGQWVPKERIAVGALNAEMTLTPDQALELGRRLVHFAETFEVDASAFVTSGDPDEEGDE